MKLVKARRSHETVSGKERFGNLNEKERQRQAQAWKKETSSQEKERAKEMRSLSEIVRLTQTCMGCPEKKELVYAVIALNHMCRELSTQLQKLIEVEECDLLDFCQEKSKNKLLQITEAFGKSPKDFLDSESIDLILGDSQNAKSPE